MRRIFTGFVVAIAVALCHDFAAARDFTFQLTGNGGQGLLESNIDPATGEPGTGGIGSTGITYDAVTNILHVDVEWGSAFGYTDTSTDVFKLHLHGPTADPAPGSFGQTANLLITLSNSQNFNGLASGGGVNDDFFLDEENETHLLEGRLYVNVHLSDTDTGMIRGYLVQSIPEPSSLVLLLAAGAACALRRKRYFDPAWSCGSERPAFAGSTSGKA